jgi:glyoxylase-like metal-dependent hydrolase (beta-lactamase superfamily II)
MQTPSISSVAIPRLFETSGGAKIYQIALEIFPGFWGHVYLALVDGYRVLIDTGSGFGKGNQQLEDRLRAVSKELGESVSLDRLTHVLITHGHIDHFGGLSYVRPRTQALVGVHELDLRNLTNHEERLAVVSRRLGDFLTEAGVPDGHRQELIDLYKFSKSLYHSVRVDFTYEAAGMRVGPFEFLHTPGHCAGQVVIRLHDVLFSGDHVLEHTSPHQSPERLTLSTGLDHYLKSLDGVEAWAKGVRLALGGHHDPILDLPSRLEQIRTLHSLRLAKVLDLLETPRTIAEVSHSLFGEVHGYNVLLALEEAGAHVEYLYQRGRLGIENLAELDNSTGPVPIRYYRLS